MKRKPIRALLLSAGFGTRLRPLTYETPKCLVEVNGESLLLRWLRILDDIGCESVLVNTHHLSQKIDNVLHQIDNLNIKIQTTYEKELLGTAGTLINNKDFFNNCTGLLIHSDNLTNVNLNNFIKAHYKKNNQCVLTMLTFKTDTPKSCGIVETDNIGILKNFYEKHENPPSNIANGAIYAFDNALFKELENSSKTYKDFSLDVIPTLIGKVQTWYTKSNLIDIGTHQSLKKAEKIFKN